jgi:hypothetical protein
VYQAVMEADDLAFMLTQHARVLVAAASNATVRFLHIVEISQRKLYGRRLGLQVLQLPVQLFQPGRFILAVR